MSNYYDDDDYDFTDKSENITDDFEIDLSSDEFDQYLDSKDTVLDEIEYQVRYAEERITLAQWEGATSDEIERLEDELEVLMLDYMRIVEKGE